ncbi:hypothetical protein PV326_004922 [Microctonus aethiopoides]|nr:hypothetical protein PV326_004922 [Microctonus aethiopoides]
MLAASPGSMDTGGSPSELRFRCVMCGRGYRSRSSLTRHSRYECGGLGSRYTFTCTLCGKYFCRPDHLKQHILNIHVIIHRSTIRDGNYICTTCGKRYRNSSSLNRHTRYGCGRTSYRCECPICGRFYSRPDTLADHLARSIFVVNHWPYPRRSRQYNHRNGGFECQRCGRVYSHTNNLSRHIKYECGKEPRFKCPYCDLRSKQRPNTYRHIRECHPGQKVSKQRGNSFLHIKLKHPGENVYALDLEAGT